MSCADSCGFLAYSGLTSALSGPRYSPNLRRRRDNLKRACGAHCDICLGPLERVVRHRCHFEAIADIKTRKPIGVRATNARTNGSRLAAVLKAERTKPYKAVMRLNATANRNRPSPDQASEDPSEGVLKNNNQTKTVIPKKKYRPTCKTRFARDSGR